MSVTNGPAEVSSPAEVRFGTSQPQRRVTVAFRIILAIPQLIVVGVIGYGAEIVIFLGWFAALFTGRMPESFARFVTGYVRWYARVQAYAYLMTDQYPPFSLDPDPSYAVDMTVTTGRLNRAAVLFRIVLVVPAVLVASALAFGWQFLSFFFWIITLVKGRMPDSIFGATASVVRYQARLVSFFAMLTSVYPGGVFGDTGADGVRVDSLFSGTPEAPPPPPPPPGAWAPPPPSAPGTWAPPPPSGTWAPAPPPISGTWAPAPVPAWGGEPGATAPAPPLPPMPPAPSGTPTPAGPPAPVPTAPSQPAGSPAPPAPVPSAPSEPAGSDAPAPAPPPPPPPAYSLAPPPPPVPAPPTPFDAGPGRIWPLVLSKAARTLTTVLLVLGAIGVVAYVVIIPTSVHFSASLSTSVGAVVAADQTQSAYDALQTPTNTFVSGSKSCRATAPSTSGELQCLQSVDSTFATAIQGYQTTLSGISYPSVAQSDADAAIASARQVDTLLQSLATAPDAQTYSSIAASPAFTSSLHSLDSTYNQLMTTLNNA